MPTFDHATHADLVAVANEQIINAILLGIGHVRDLLARPTVGATAIKSLMSALAIASDQLSRHGYSLADEAQSAPAMRIEEHTAAEIEAIQAQAERDFHGGGPDHD